MKNIIAKGLVFIILSVLLFGCAVGPQLSQMQIRQLTVNGQIIPQ